MKITDLAIFFKSDFRSFAHGKVLSLRLFGDGAGRSLTSSKLAWVAAYIRGQAENVSGWDTVSTFQRNKRGALSPQRQNTYWACLRAPGPFLAQKEERDLRNKFPHTLVFHPAVSHKQGKMMRLVFEIARTGK